MVGEVNYVQRLILDKMYTSGTLSYMDNIQAYSIRETREQLSKLVELVSLTGSRFLVTKFGRPQAAIVAVPKEWLKKPKEITDYFGFMEPGESGISLENRARRNKRERDYITQLRQNS